MNRIKVLPNWVLPDTLPSVYDTQSGTALEMVAKVYGAMETLQNDYNAFANEVNTAINNFINGTNQDQEAFKAEITKIMHEYIAMLDDKINMLENQTINEVTEFMTKAFEDGKIVITTNYDEDTKNLTIVGGVN